MSMSGTNLTKTKLRNHDVSLHINTLKASLCRNWYLVQFGAATVSECYTTAVNTNPAEEEQPSQGKPEDIFSRNMIHIHKHGTHICLVQHTSFQRVTLL